MDPIEMIDNAINGRSEPKVIRIKLTDAQLEKLKAGKILDFIAGQFTVMLCKK
jgi:hypothetical protein